VAGCLCENCADVFLCSQACFAACSGGSRPGVSGVSQTGAPRSYSLVEILRVFLRQSLGITQKWLPVLGQESTACSRYGLICHIFPLAATSAVKQRLFPHSLNDRIVRPTKITNFSRGLRCGRMWHILRAITNRSIWFLLQCK